MTAAEFRQAGETLFGEEGWQMCLAKLLCVNVRNVERWANGQNAIPDDDTLGPLLLQLVAITEPRRNRDV